MSPLTKGDCLFLPGQIILRILFSSFMTSFLSIKYIIMSVCLSGRSFPRNRPILAETYQNRPFKSIRWKLCTDGGGMYLSLMSVIRINVKISYLHFQWKLIFQRQESEERLPPLSMPAVNECCHSPDNYMYTVIKLAFGRFSTLISGCNCHSIADNYDKKCMIHKFHVWRFVRYTVPCTPLFDINWTFWLIFGR